jgi:hypothetical protein
MFGSFGQVGWHGLGQHLHHLRKALGARHRNKQKPKQMKKEGKQI